MEERKQSNCSGDREESDRVITSVLAQGRIILVQAQGEQLDDIEGKQRIASSFICKGTREVATLYFLSEDTLYSQKIAQNQKDWFLSQCQIDLALAIARYFSPDKFQIKPN